MLLRCAGEWREGLRWGHGTVVLPNGSKYEGEFKNDQIHGLGATYSTVTSLQSVVWGAWNDVEADVFFAGLLLHRYGYFQEWQVPLRGDAE